MNGALLLVVTVLYMIVGLRYLLDGNPGLAISFIAYGIANIGIWYSGR